MKDIRNLVKSEIQMIRDKGCLSDEETDILTMLSRKRSRTEISMFCGISVPTVGRRIKSIKEKVDKIESDINSQ